MLQVRDVVKTYDGRAVVNRVSFEVQTGEIFALLGPNGAGKTTLIRMITDILRPDSGEILLSGESVASQRRPGIAYLPEERGLYRKVPVVDALAYYGELKGLARGTAKASAMDLLKRFGLDAWAKKEVQALSKGMQQKVQLCTALIGDPKLLILDEPFSGLDPLNVQLFEDVLQERRALGTTVLLSTHQMNKVEQLCDRALLINRGHMVMYGSVRELRKKYAEHAMLVRGGPVPDGLPGVVRSDLVDGQTKLLLERDTRPTSVLRALLDAGVTIESFMPAEPPLEDIFVHVVTRGIGLDEGKSGSPTVDEPAVAGGVR
jgi:ABC-2 type transport system ATP-binding protein